MLGTLVRNRCLVKQLVSRGGFGTTYLIEDQDCFDEPRILKELRPASLDDDDSKSDSTASKALAERLFKREAQTLVNLNHSGIPKLYGYFIENGYSYLLQEYIPGANLAEEVTETGETYSEADARKLLREITEILHYLHTQDPPIIHRDIKPQNLMRHTNGKLLLIDFGAVCRAANKATSSQTLIGSPGYAPPEQILGQPVPQSDLYAAAATIVRLITGIHPSQLSNRKTDRVEWQQHVTVSEPFRDLLNRLLARDPELRISSASEVLNRLLDMESVPPLPKGYRTPSVSSSFSSNEPTAATVASAESSHQEFDFSDMGALMEAMLVVPITDIVTAKKEIVSVGSGSLSSVPVPVLLFLCYHQGLSGQLVFSRRGVNKTIYFDQGAIVFAASSEKEERLSEHLLRNNRLSAEDFFRATQIVDATGQRMGTVLLQLGIISLEELTPLVVEHVSNIAYSVFDWTEGSYKFTAAPAVVEEIKMPFSTADVIFEGIRKLDNLELIKQWLGSFTRPLCATSDPLLLYQAVTLYPHEGFIVSRIDSSMSIEELLSLGGLPEVETLRTVCGLIAIGMLEAVAKETVHHTQQTTAVASVLTQPNPLPQDLDFSNVATFCYEVENKVQGINTLDAYALLEVSRNANDMEVQEAYTNLARKFHPDRNSQLLNYNISLKTELEKIFDAVSNAYESIKTKEARNYYNNSRNSNFRVSQQNTSFEIRSVDSTSIYNNNANFSNERSYPKVSSSEQTFIYSNPNRGTRSQNSNNLKSGQEWFEYGQGLYLSGKYAEAQDALEKAIQLEPNSATYHFYLARTLSKVSGMFQNAELEFYRALELDPNNADYYAEFGLFYQHLNLSDRAQAMFTYCLSLAPNHPIAQRSLRQK
jgi:serine/threonine protein kinase